MNAMQLRTDLEQELTRILDYWMKHAPDQEHGGFMGEIDNFNIPVEGASKGAILHARILWTFASSYRMQHSPAYLEYAKMAYEYFSSHFVDEELGGVYWELDAKGAVCNDRKQIYAIAFAIYGISEYYRACGDEGALELAKRLYASIEEHSFDETKNGYVEALSRDWQPMDDVRLSDKDENALKTMNTHLHILEAYANLYRVWKDEGLKKQLKNLIELFLDIIIQDDYHFGLFFDMDWNLSSHNVSPGHDIEGSWLLYEAAEVLGDEALIERLKPVVIEMARATADGGVSVDYAVLEELHVATGERDTDRHWWPQSEGIVGFYNAYQLTDDEHFAELSCRIWEYTRSNLLDMENGEWFSRVDESGHPVIEASKVGFWKCPYHNSRACMEIMSRIAVD